VLCGKGVRGIDSRLILAPQQSRIITVSMDRGVDGVAVSDARLSLSSRGQVHTKLLQQPRLEFEPARFFLNRRWVRVGCSGKSRRAMPRVTVTVIMPTLLLLLLITDAPPLPGVRGESAEQAVVSATGIGRGIFTVNCAIRVTCPRLRCNAAQSRGHSAPFRTALPR
jgi:hypothetical protein